ncbi:MAG TPA: helix-turn-helix domain-containing protein [Chloroflexota bacterium]|nr:helix-turn-helix domain-containing protein [Chloroflexota bacterium]
MGGTPALPVLDTVTLAVCQHVADRLESEAADLAATMTTAVVNEIPEYTTAAAPGQRQIVFEHSLDHVYAVVRAVRTWSLPAGPELAFVRERAALRATQHVPLSALLHSYRLGHRTVWERLVQLLAGQDNILDASLALTTLTLSYTELISGVLAEGYVERQRQLLVQIDRDQRDFLEDVLRGTFERQVDSPRLTSTFALVPGADFLVLVVHACPTESGPHAGDSLTRAAETLKRHFALGVAQPFVVVRHAEIISIAPVARARPAAIAHLTRQALAELEQHAGERWVAGVSTVCAGLAEVARGYQEARLAADSAPAGGGVYALLERRVSDYLVERADGTAVRMVPPAARRLFDSPYPDDQVLVRTLLTYASADMAVAATADQLSIHPNTVSYRLRKLSRLLDRDVSTFSSLVEVVTWARIIDQARAKP